MSYTYKKGQILVIFNDINYSAVVNAFTVNSTCLNIKMKFPT